MATLKTYARIDVNTNKLDLEIKESGFIQNYTGFSITTELEIFGESILNESGLDDLIANHDPEDLVFDEKKKYVTKRQIDGQNAFFDLMSELRVNSIQNSYPRSVNKFIERKLKSVRDEILIGQWISAKEYLDEVTVESHLTQELWDRINLKLTSYIADNY